MLFNSYIFIFAFLPITLIGYFSLNRYASSKWGKIWLVVASLFFYSYWNVRYLPLILTSILVNFLVGNALVHKSLHERISPKTILILGLIFNIGLLGYYKYTDFFLANINAAFNTSFILPHIILPLGISFFTFTQIAYLVDAYRGEAREYNLINYALFVSFFPHLLAGPILRHSHMIPQFLDENNKSPDSSNMATGIFLFIVGLFKKVIIADTFAVWANFGFDTASSLTFIEAWVTSLSYTMQLYFDFSAYTDMALGTGYMLNIKMPINFNSPYKSYNIQDFWRRWHITLGNFLRDYIYIPLGGNRGGEWKTYRNLMITFLIGGLWHGAGWTFVFWGFLHGAAQVVHRAWKKLQITMPRALAWFLTFNFVNVAWVFFRAKTWNDALKVLAWMIGMNGVVLPTRLADSLSGLTALGVTFAPLGQSFAGISQAVILLTIFMVVVLTVKNSIELSRSYKANLGTAVVLAALATWCLFNMNQVSEFLYFNF
ncbi:MAG TPA: MBOAT family protein [Syntrophomonadaceae bacterium]|nr:MBOAT family protein [Syntrophomonadaceae bacterium]